MKTRVILLWLLLSIPSHAQQPEPASINALEQKLAQAERQLAQLNDAVHALRAELALIKGGRANTPQPVPAALAPQTASAENAQREFAERLLAPGIGASEREATLQAKPEIFIQSR